MLAELLAVDTVGSNAHYPSTNQLRSNWFLVTFFNEALNLSFTLIMNVDDLFLSSLASFKDKIASEISGVHNAFENEYHAAKARRGKAEAYSDQIGIHCSLKQSDLTSSKSSNHNDDVFSLNVGGKGIYIQKNVIESDQLDFLLIFLSNRWNYILLTDRDGVTFLDMDPAWIQPILDSFLINQ